MSVSDHPRGEAFGIGDQAGIACHGCIATLSVGFGDGSGACSCVGGYATSATGSVVGDAVAFTGMLTLLVLIFAERVAACDGRIVVPRAGCDDDMSGAEEGVLKFKSKSTTSDERKIMTTARALRSILTPTMHYPAGIYL